MTRKFGNDEELVTAIHELPKTIEPCNEQWPAIAARLESHHENNQQAHHKIGWKTGWRSQAIAASLAIAFIAGLISGRQIGTQDPRKEIGPAQNLVMQATRQASEQEYQAAFREFIPVGHARTVLASQTIMNIENSWAELQQAETALLAAIRNYPENSYLNQKLLDLRSQQLGFMKQLAMLDQFSRRKT